MPLFAKAGYDWILEAIRPEIPSREDVTFKELATLGDAMRPRDTIAVQLRRDASGAAERQLD